MSLHATALGYASMQPQEELPMKAAVLVGFGGVDQLELREMPEPSCGPGEVKVRVVATSVNPIDWKLREGAKRPGVSLELPAILGRVSGPRLPVSSWADTRNAWWRKRKRGPRSPSR
jgi:hypothetical protein